ncbi:hypothetical protein DZF91_01460 [Actinomadura logoneensis]|uniref:Uncharacterized protein n=1 Tax=Actinomadura logoneensis TaxID=2293572 RepID=A0A372JUH2_9ACTN|nr:hypothetical protein [Actinomadura logoneensis]RFU43384.1 hypothetical protein DZF91_01460 [Actinomadura logoneensis]
MTTLTLNEIEKALRATWAADTCSPDDVERAPWTPANPAWGHCDITSLVVHDFFGGRLVRGEVFTAGGEPVCMHWWNLLDSGVELDLTLDQFRDGQRVVRRETVERPLPYPRFRKDEYILLRDRMATHLGHYPRQN